MHPDLDRLIRLQALETAAESARRTIADEPARQEDLNARLAGAQKVLDEEKQRLAANQSARRDLDKEVALHQGRLSKYRDQLMTVKTNREYQAMQKEIETAQHEIQAIEDRMLERMIEFDEITAHVRTAEIAFAGAKKAIDEERRALAKAVADATASLDVLAHDRAVLAAECQPALLASFDRLVKHRSTTAVVPARDGRCSACQVRIRPQVYNELRRHEIVFYCESCQRVLYFDETPAPAAAAGTP